MEECECIYPGKMLPFWIGICATLILIIAYRITQFWHYALLTGFAFLYSVLLYFIIRKWHIEIFDEKIVIKSPGIRREFFWKDVCVTFITGKLSYDFGYYYWFFGDFSGERFGFDVNFFTRKQLRKIAKVVIRKCSDNNIDIKIMNISEGKFPWYIL